MVVQQQKQTNYNSVQQRQLMREPGTTFNATTANVKNNLNLGTCGPTQCSRGKLPRRKTHASHTI